LREFKIQGAVEVNFSALGVVFTGSFEQLGVVFRIKLGRLALFLC